MNEHSPKFSSGPAKVAGGPSGPPNPHGGPHLSADPLQSREKPPVAVLPTREQLGIIIDRTERHMLTPAETHSLRLGLKHLAAQLGGAGAAIRRLTDELERVRGERDAARAAHDVALAERDAARSAVKLTGAQRIACPYCGAAAGQRCRAMRGVVPPRTPHTARLEAAS